MRIIIDTTDTGVREAFESIIALGNVAVTDLQDEAGWLEGITMTLDEGPVTRTLFKIDLT